MSFRNLRAEHQRICILLALSASPGYEANSAIIQDELDRFGMPASRDEVHGHLAWLVEQGLLTTENPANAVTVAALTPRGLDVANGRAVVPGVKRPGPRDH